MTPPLVLLHAFPLDSAMYDAVRTPLAEVTALHTPDFPGFGGTDLPADDPSLDVYADAVVAAMDDWGMPRVILGGTSMGGYTAMALLRRHANRVAGLVLIDTKAAADPPEGADGRRAMADRLEREGTSAALVEAVFPKLLGATTFDRRPEVVDQVRAQVTGASPAAAAWAQRAMAARPDSLATLREVTVPTLVVVGEEDVLAPPTEAAAMVAAISGASLAMIPAAGHLTPLETPDAVVDVLAPWLRSL